MAKELAAWALLLVQGCGDLRCGWRDAAAREVERRERREASRELLRVCMRAWREVADAPRAVVLSGDLDFAFAGGETSSPEPTHERVTNRRREDYSMGAKRCGAQFNLK